MKAMLLAAGLGTRLKPFTDYHPKALAVVNQKTLLERNIAYLMKYGVTDILVNVHHFADQIINFLHTHPFGITISISDEQDQVLETGGGVKKAAWFFKDSEPFVLMNVDILTDFALDTMLQHHAEHKPLVTLAVSDRKSSRCFLFNQNMHLVGWKNNATGEIKCTDREGIHAEYSFSGIHIIDPTIFRLLTQEGKFSIVDSYLSLMESHTILGFKHTNCNLMDVGKPESILLAEQIFK
jgi:MurNAc alpha-1-phosphate uridylyltransferase